MPEAIERCRALLEDVRGYRNPEALLEAALSHLEAMRGNVNGARALYRKSRAMLEELGWTFLAAQTSFDSGPVEMLAGDLEAAEAELRRDYDALERMGETNYISTIAALLAEVLYRKNDLEGADEFTRISEELAAHDDVSSQFRWRSVRGKILASRGSFDEGEKLAREAVELIGGSDDPNSQGEALIDLAEVLRFAGRPRQCGGGRPRCPHAVRSEGQHRVGGDSAGDGRRARVARRQLITIRRVSARCGDVCFMGF